MDSKFKLLSMKTAACRDGGRSHLCADLGAAIAHHQIFVHFQPQYELCSGRACGVEALARWPRIGGRDVPPSLFIPIAERMGMISEMGVSVLYQACSAISGWRGQADMPPSLSVNVSARQITPVLSDVVASILELTDFPAQRLELEVTEGVLIADTELAIDCLNDCRRLGVKIALDDFGTGYSSFGYLSRLPVDRLKLDKCFIQRMPFERKSAAIVRSLLALGRELEIMVMAEGVESELQLEMLGEFGCAQIQGNLLAKCLPAAEARALFEMPWGARYGAAAPHGMADGGLHAA